MRLAPKGNAVKSGLTSTDGGCFILRRLALTTSLWSKTLVAIDSGYFQEDQVAPEIWRTKRAFYCKRTCSNTLEPLLNPLLRKTSRKGTVESNIQYTQGTALKGRKFESIQSQNSWRAHWEEKWAAPKNLWT